MSHLYDRIIYCLKHSEIDDKIIALLLRARPGGFTSVYSHSVFVGPIDYLTINRFCCFAGGVFGAIGSCNKVAVIAVEFAVSLLIFT